jgi:catechol 2,3-dioxygenase
MSDMGSMSVGEFRIHPDTRPGHVHHTVADLERELEFYQKVIGLRVHWRDGATAALGAGGPDLLRLTEERNAQRFRGTTGMYHFAILLPNRRELARVISRLFAMRYPNYPTDHIMTKTTYLDDPEGNNIEIYTDTPEDGTMSFANGMAETRRADGTLSDGREPLDVEALFGELTPDDRLDQPMPEETRIGHVHLYVADLDATRDFYHGLLGFDDMGIARDFRMGMVSAGRYHHHIGYNTWVGQGAPPPPAGSLGLRYFTFVLPSKPDLEAVLERIANEGAPVDETAEGFLLRDPSQNAMVLQDRAVGDRRPKDDGSAAR